jgi:hypothetical protein
MTPRRHVLLLFLDGVGLGVASCEHNPFSRAEMPALADLLGRDWFLRSRGPIFAQRASLVPTDACLGVQGRPQSATGQATLMTGLNVARAVGQHYGPFPNHQITTMLTDRNLLMEARSAGQAIAFLNPYPTQFFQAVQSGRRAYSAIQVAVLAAGLGLRTHDDLVAGRAVSPDFTAEAWRSRLRSPETPLLTPEVAGRHLAKMAQGYNLTVFDHWPSDLIGHSQDLAAAVALLERLDMVVGGLLGAWDADEGLLVITSDHGNLEDLSTRHHTCNPVPTILVGRDHQRFATGIRSLMDIAPVVLRFLSDGS